MILLNFTCNKSILNEALNNVSKAVSLKSTILALEGIKIILKNGKINLTGYDLEMGIKTEIDVTESNGEGEFVINAKLFNDIIRKMTCEEVTINVSENLETKIFGGQAEYDIIALSTEDYPEIPDFDRESSFDISEPLLKNMINQTIFAVAVIDNKPILMGELFEIENGQFNLVAIDGYRLAVRSEMTQCKENYSFVVPAKALKEVSNLLKEDAEKICTIFTSKKHIIFNISGYKVISRLLEGEFHNYKASLPISSATEVIIKTREFINSLDRCSLLINEKMKAPVRCIFNDGEVKMTCSTSLGKFSDCFKVDLSGPMVEIGFNCKYLLESLKATESDQVKLQLNSGVSPMKIVPLDSDEYVFLVLPVRLKVD